MILTYWKQEIFSILEVLNNLSDEDFFLTASMSDDDFYEKYLKNNNADLSMLTNKDRDDFKTLIYESNGFNLGLYFCRAAIDDDFRDLYLFGDTTKLKKQVIYENASEMHKKRVD